MANNTISKVPALPAVDFLENLTAHQLVAYATRCALRILPYLDHKPGMAQFRYQLVMTGFLVSIGRYDNGEMDIEHIKSLFDQAEDEFNDSESNEGDNLSWAFYGLILAVIRLLEDKPLADMAFEVADKQRMIPFEGVFIEKATLVDVSYLKQLRNTPKNYSPVEVAFFSRPLWSLSDKDLREQLTLDARNLIENLNVDWIENEIKGQMWYGDYLSFFNLDGLAKIDADKILKSWLNYFEVLDSSEEPDIIKSKINIDGSPCSIGSGLSDVDMLGRQNLIDALSELIASDKQDTPFTIGILGDWGSGKSNVMHLLRKKLKERELDNVEKFHFADFNAWQYEHTDNMAAGVAQEVVNGFMKGQSFIGRWYTKLRFGLKVNGIPFLIILLLPLLVSLLISLLGSHTSNFIQFEWYYTLWSYIPILVLFYKRVSTIYNHPLMTKINNYIKLPSYLNHLGSIPILKKHVNVLCEIILPDRPTVKTYFQRIWSSIFQYKRSRLVVFVDDLDRCDHGAIIRTLDATRLVMDIKNVIVILGLDYRIAHKAVEQHYKEFESWESSSVAREYLGKIFQLTVELRKPSSQHIQTFIVENLFKDKLDNSIADSDRLGKLEFDENRESVVSQPVDSNTDVGSEDSINSPKLDTVPKMSTENNGTSQSGDLASQELMLESVEEIDHFNILCQNFKFHNPRQLIRLRNSYRLLKRVYRNEIDEWKDYLTILFLVEYFCATIDIDTNRIEKAITNRTVMKQFKNTPVSFMQDFFGKKYKNTNEYAEYYYNIKLRIVPFVLPSIPK